MKRKKLIRDTEIYVKQVLEHDSSGHDWWHIQRVRNLALMIAKSEKADLFVVEIAALLHDLDDWKLVVENGSQQRTLEWLDKNGVERVVSDKICRVIEGVSFKGANVDTTTTDRECAVLQDADRLDAMGAIGIARTFAFGGNRNRAIYDPGNPPLLHNDFEAYKKSEGTTINHFYEKLLLLKERMQTEKGKAIAEQRHEFMLRFLEQFYAEWSGHNI